MIAADDGLRTQARAGYSYEQLIAAHLGRDLGQPTEALAPRLTAVTVVTGLRELYQTHEAQGGADATKSTEDLLTLVDQVLTFASAGIAATQ